MVVTSQTIALQLDQVAHSNKDAVKTAAMSATVAATTTHAMREHAHKVATKLTKGMADSAEQGAKQPPTNVAGIEVIVPLITATCARNA